MGWETSIVLNKRGKKESGGDVFFPCQKNIANKGTGRRSAVPTLKKVSLEKDDPRSGGRGGKGEGVSSVSKPPARERLDPEGANKKERIERALRSLFHTRAIERKGKQP